MLGHIPQKISTEDNISLEKDVIEEEISCAIWSLEQEKAPGPDGFSIIFFKHFWDLIKFDLCKMINYTLQKKKLGDATNSIFPSLIPK